VSENKLSDRVSSHGLYPCRCAVVLLTR
jgi:hypothetical protein